MPFALVTIGLLLVITGFQNTYAQLGKQVAGDFTGPGNFTYWVIAIVAVGALGYSDDLKPFSRAFLVLIIIGMFLTKNGAVAQGQSFFQNFNSDIAAGTSKAPLPAGGNDAALNGGGGAGGGGIVSDIGTAVSVFSTISSFF